MSETENLPPPLEEEEPRRFPFWLVLIVLALMLMSYKCGERGPNPTRWFAPPTATATSTSTSTSTSTPTSTPTSTETPTSTPTATCTATPKPAPKRASRHAPKPVIRKKPARVAKKPAAPASPKPAPTAAPICTAQVTAPEIQEVEPNDVFYEAQELGNLGPQGQVVVRGRLSEVGINTGDITGDHFRQDPRAKLPNLDRDVYTFTLDQPGFQAILDCYTSKAGPPSPASDDNDYQLEVYNEKFMVVGSSLRNDPVESVECRDPGRTFYVVVYGFSGKPGPYRLSILKK